MTADARADRARLFFALWPDAAVREALAAAARDAQTGCGGRATAPDKLHMTLFFVGDIERSRVETLKTLAGAIEGRPFELAISAVGYWRHNRIVWAGSARCPSQLAALVADLQGKLSPAGMCTEDRPFLPHVTLVRNARHPPRKKAIIPLVWSAHDFVLVESAPARGGVSYEVISRWPLTAPL